MQRLILVAAAGVALLGGCGWFDSAPTTSEKARPGAERQVTATNALPGASAGRQYDASVAPVDETSSAARIGSVVAGKGGQKAQKETADKEANEREAKAREERARVEREAALKKGVDPTAKPAPPADAPPPAAVPAAPAAPTADTKQ